MKMVVSKTLKTVAPEPKGYGMQLSIWILVLGLFLSVVDLTFLVDVMRKVLDASEENPVPYALSVGIGLIGFSIMAHLGSKYGHHHRVKVAERVAHYLVWILLGVCIALIRLISASVLGLEPESEEVTKIFGMLVREIDLILAPFMLLMHIAAGWLALDGTKNLVGSEDFQQWLRDRKLNKWRKQIEKSVAMSTQAAIRAQNEMSKVPIETDPRVLPFVKEAKELLAETMGAAKETEKLAEIDLAKSTDEDVKSAVGRAKSSARKAVQKANLLRAKVDGILRPIGPSGKTTDEIAYDNAKVAFGEQVNIYRKSHDEVAEIITDIEKIDQEIRTIENAASNIISNIKTAALTSKSDITMKVKHGERAGR